MAAAARRFLTQRLLPQHVAQLGTGFKFLQRRCDKWIVMLHVTILCAKIVNRYNNVALKIVTCNITLKYTCCHLRYVTVNYGCTKKA